MLHNHPTFFLPLSCRAKPMDSSMLWARRVASNFSSRDVASEGRRESAAKAFGLRPPEYGALFGARRNEFLGRRGGIVKRKGAPKGYEKRLLKLQRQCN